MTFDPSTAYAQDWRYQDFVEDANYEPPPGDSQASQSAFPVKFRCDDTNNPDFAGLTSQIVIGEQDSAGIVWNHSSAALTIKTNGVLRTDDNAAWVVRSSRYSRFGYWQVVVEPERTDSAD